MHVGWNSHYLPFWFIHILRSNNNTEFLTDYKNLSKPGKNKLKGYGKAALQQEIVRQIVYLSYVQKGDFIRYEINLVVW